MATRDDRLVDELELRGEGKTNAEVQIRPASQDVDGAEATPAVEFSVESLPRVPDGDEVPEDITIYNLDGSEEGFKAIHPLNLANLDNTVKGPGFVFVATGLYRDFYDLDKIYSVEPGNIVPRDTFLIADRDLVAEPARSRQVGRKVRRLEEAGFYPSIGTPTVDNVHAAVRVDSSRRAEPRIVPVGAPNTNEEE